MDINLCFSPRLNDRVNHSRIWLICQAHESRIAVELCHGKTCLKVFVVVIPKAGLADGALWHRLHDIICESSRVQLPANPSLGVTTTKFLRHDFPWHSFPVVALEVGRSTNWSRSKRISLKNKARLLCVYVIKYSSYFLAWNLCKTQRLQPGRIHPLTLTPYLVLYQFRMGNCFWNFQGCYSKVVLTYWPLTHVDLMIELKMP